MSVLHYDKLSDSFLLGIGGDLYQYSGDQTKFLVKCGEIPDIPAPEDGGKALRAEGPAYITGVATSAECVAVINNNKVVETFDREFQRRASTVAMKRPTSVQVTNKNVVISDKAGDAYSYDLNLTNRKYLLGHVSVVMDMLLTPDNKFLVTCDRDEKIRVSHFPNCYNIEFYLLGHEEYVLKILLLSPNILLSIGGDEKLLLWDLSTQTILQTLTSVHGDFTGVTYAAPYLLVCTARHITIYKLTDNTLTQTYHHVSEHDIVSMAASDARVILLTRQPMLESYQFSEGVMSNVTEVKGEFDLAKCANSGLPEKKKAARTAGFTDYFERKRKRIEEETLKEENRKVK